MSVNVNQVGETPNSMGFEITCRACDETAYVTKPTEAETFMVAHANHAAGVVEQ